MFASCWPAVDLVLVLEPMVWLAFGWLILVRLLGRSRLFVRHSVPVIAWRVRLAIGGEAFAAWLDLTISCRAPRTWSIACWFVTLKACFFRRRVFGLLISGIEMQPSEPVATVCDINAKFRLKAAAPDRASCSATVSDTVGVRPINCRLICSTRTVEWSSFSFLVAPFIGVFTDVFAGVFAGVVIALITALFDGLVTNSQWLLVNEKLSLVWFPWWA